MKLKIPCTRNQTFVFQLQNYNLGAIFYYRPFLYDWFLLFLLVSNDIYEKKNIAIFIFLLFYINEAMAQLNLSDTVKVSSDSIWKYDPKYMQCYTRLAFRTNKETGETVGCLMTVIPNLEWLEKSNFKPFMEVTYLFRSKDFGGMIWNYQNVNSHTPDFSLKKPYLRRTFAVPSPYQLRICPVFSNESNSPFSMIK